MIRALLIGYGKMGRLIGSLAPQYSIAISAVVDHQFDFANSTLPDACTGYSSLTQEAIDSCDIAFDFCSSKEIVARTLMLAESAKPLIIGTTGWEKHEKEVKDIIAHYKSALLYAPNFSLGVALFLRLAKDAAEIISPFPQYDVGIVDTHHNQKLDAPSGTAKALLNGIKSYYPDKTIDVASIRSGYHPGTHEVSFDSQEDTIHLTHTARSREGFARGALQAAYWLIEKKGVYTLDDMISEMIYSKPTPK